MCRTRNKLEEKRNAYSSLVGKLKGKRQPRRSRHRWDDIKIVVREGQGGMDFDSSVWDVDQWLSLVNT